MSLFKSITTDAAIADERDSVGGAGVLDSDIYKATIALAYGSQSVNGAIGLVLHFKTDQDRDIKQTFWMTSGTLKGAKNYYEKDGKKNYLPGYLHAQSLALLTCGKEVNTLTSETKVVKIYNFESKAEVPTKVEVMTELLGKEILIGLVKQTVAKTVKNDAGVYVPTFDDQGLAITRDENEIDKLFRASDRMTTAEIRAKAEIAEFADTWATKWKGKTRDKTSKFTGVAGVPKSAVMGTKKPTTSLFTTN